MGFIVVQVSDYSVWLIVAVTAERYLVVCHPFRAGDVCSTPRARRLVLVLLAAFLALNSHFFWTVGIRDYGPNGGRLCFAAGDAYKGLVHVSFVCLSVVVRARLRYAARKNTAWNGERWSSQRKTAQITWRQHRGVDMPVTVVLLLRIADDRSRWAAITAEASVGVPPTKLRRHGTKVTGRTPWFSGKSSAM